MTTPPLPPTEDAAPRTAQAVLTAGDVDDLFRDLSACTAVEHISVKQALGRQSAATLGHRDLTHARLLLDDPDTHAVQLRYRHDGTLWIDTITRDADRYQLLRVQHPAQTPDATQPPETTR